MNNAIRKIIIAGGLFLFLNIALASPKEEETGNKVSDYNPNKEIRSPAIEDDGFPTFDDQPAEFSIGSLISGRVGKFFNDFLQFPATIFRFVSGIIANQPFAKLREEVRNLNISYPK